MIVFPPQFKNVFIWEQLCYNLTISILKNFFHQALEQNFQIFRNMGFLKIYAYLKWSLLEILTMAGLTRVYCLL